MEMKPQDDAQPPLPTAAQLVERYGRAVWAVCLGMVHHYQDAEDLVQDVMVKAVSRLHQLRESRHAGPWLLSIARTACLNHLKRRKSAAPLSEGLSAPEGSSAYEYEHVHKAIERLPSEYAEIIRLFYLTGKKSTELAELLGLSSAAVRQRLVRGRAMLHDLLKEERP